MPRRVIHAALYDCPAVLLYHSDDTVDAYRHDGLAWREISPHAIVRDATPLSPREYAGRWPGLKLPTHALAA
jgi:hypothetical protein